YNPLCPAFQLILAEKFRQRPRIVRYLLYHDPCPASRRAWLPAFFSGGLARLGRKNSSNLNRFLRPAAGIIFLAFWLFGFCASSAPNLIWPAQLLGLFRPIRSSPTFGKANSIVWMTPNEWPGAWMPLGRVCSIGFGKRGSAGTRARGVRKGIPPLAIPAAEGRKKPSRSDGQGRSPQ